MRGQCHKMILATSGNRSRWASASISSFFAILCALQITTWENTDLSGISFEQMVIDNDTGGVNRRHKIIRTSMYDVYMRRWLRYFSLDQFHFVNAEKLEANPAKELYNVEQFLGIRHKLTKDVFFINKNTSLYCMCVGRIKLDARRDKQVGVDNKCLLSRKHPAIDWDVLTKLRHFFRAHNNRLYKMIGINFGWA